MNLAEKYKEMLKEQNDDPCELQLQEFEQELWEKAGLTDLSLVQVIETDDYFDRAFHIIEREALNEQTEVEETALADELRAKLQGKGWQWIIGEEGSMLFKDSEPVARFSYSCRGAIILFGFIFKTKEYYRTNGKAQEGKPGWDFGGGWKLASN